MNREKFSIEPDDEIEDVLEALGRVEADDIALVIPRNAEVVKARFGLRKLKETAHKLSKNIVIESIDEDIIALAHKNGLEAINPLFLNKRKVVADIVVSHHRKYVKPFHAISRIFNRFNKKVATVFLLVMILGGSGLAIASNFLPKAQIHLILKEYPWIFEDNLVVDASISEVNVENKTVPGIILSKNKTLSTTFPATGQKQVLQKARGKITIYNNYSKESQILIATTRFETPDGKIYRIDKRVVVPGLSSIEAIITADKPGEEYNSGPVDYLSIPGFSGSSKFSKFYGKIKEDVTGGFVGLSPYPTAADILKAEKEATEMLKDNLRASLIMELPDGFKTLDDAFKFETSVPIIDDKVDSNKKFSVHVSGKMQIFGLREGDVKNLTSQLAQKQFNFNVSLIRDNLSYKNIKTNFPNKVMNLKMDYEAKFISEIAVDKFTDLIRGRNEKDLESLVLSFPGIDSATVAFTPFWVKNIPNDDKKISVDLNH